MNLDDILGQGLLPVLVNKEDTGHRITMRAWVALRSYDQTPLRAYYEHLTQEIMTLVPVAKTAWDNKEALGILQTDYALHITCDNAPDRLVYLVENEHVTVAHASEVKYSE